MRGQLRLWTRERAGGKEEKRHEACRRCHVTTAGGQSLLRLAQSHDLSLFRRSELSLPSISPSILSRLQTNLSAQTPKRVVEPKFAHKLPDTCPCEPSCLDPRRPQVCTTQRTTGLSTNSRFERLSDTVISDLSLCCAGRHHRQETACSTRSSATATAPAPAKLSSPSPPHLSETRPKENKRKQKSTPQSKTASRAMPQQERPAWLSPASNPGETMLGRWESDSSCLFPPSISSLQSQTTQDDATASSQRRVSPSRAPNNTRSASTQIVHHGMQPTEISSLCPPIRPCCACTYKSNQNTSPSAPLPNSPLSANPSRP